MNVVQPIRNVEKLKVMADYFKIRNRRNYIMFIIGTGVGLRISDILQLKKEDLLNTHIVLKERKTRKSNRVRIPPPLRKELTEYAKTLKDGEYIIKSRQGENRPIDRSTAYRILREAAEFVSLDEIGTHTLRKTFGYHTYKQTKDVAMLQQIFNHSSPSITLNYIGINQDAMDDAMKNLKMPWLQ
ncbi:tyrosine-type recombinase/integrase [Alkalihalobacillus sp. LMS39]|uniref:tyrosine-type recombinase/integrase n=1 Tax=Alkalihalobacillus sp. LMS39 TaxID=2924032 RepID=UPI001FB4729F|nr:tyrosine-type recombinase/integrase [Alkalihalobacillus sp. LMS39]UOE96061.1 tyrosine-type recombinase/integrase [Alkalihalobacillus sp. LMS39]